MQIRYCTLTGIDESVSLEALDQLADEFPFAEFGVLYSTSQAGKGRYPSLEFIQQIAERAETGFPRFALHICGSAVSEFIEQKAIVNLAMKFPRIQLNFESKNFGSEAIAAAMRRVFPDTRVITQVNEANADLGERLRFHNCYNHEMLFDASLGRGLTPEQWTPIDRFAGARFGYAGGLGPDNLGSELPRIAEAAGDFSVWVDMEGKLRNENDKFDLSRARACLEAVRAYQVAEAQKALGPDKTGLVPVSGLSKLWLDWWVGHLCGYNMVIPPKDAIKATYLHRHSGKYHSLECVDYWKDCGDELHRIRVGVLPGADGVTWNGVYQPVHAPERIEMVEGKTPREAVVRAIICRFTGPTVPANPLEYSGEFAYNHYFPVRDEGDEDDEE